MSIFPDEDRNAQLACRNDGFLGAVCSDVYALGLGGCVSYLLIKEKVVIVEPEEGTDEDRGRRKVSTVSE
jgi:hypothetical protein